MWTYKQATGELLQNGVIKGRGYSGNGVGLNNPAMESVPRVGPIPKGRYHIGVPFNSFKLGPLCIPLEPIRTNIMYGRSGFLMHGDSVAHPGQASLGCIVQDHKVRLAVYESEDYVLDVI